MLDVLRRIQEVNEARNLGAALSTMVRRIRKAMRTDVCSFYLYDIELERLVLMETIGLRSRAVKQVSMPLGEGLVGLVGQREEPLNLEDAPGASAVSSTSKKPAKSVFRAFSGCRSFTSAACLASWSCSSRDKRRYRRGRRGLPGDHGRPTGRRAGPCAGHRRFE